MTVSPLNYTSLPFLSPLIRDYLSGAEKLKPFYQYPFDFNAFEKIIQDKTFSKENRTVLSQTLKQACQKIQLHPAAAKNIELLSSENTFTVTTAHQPILFTGPLYFIYKIISTIHTASQLAEAFPEKHFVPVYFMGAEDHDFEEINHTYFFGKKLEWQENQRGACGRLPLNHVQPLLEEAETLLAGKQFSNEAISLLKDAFTQQTTLADATLHLVNNLFGAHGLVVLNPDNQSFKKLFAPVIEEELINPQSQKLSESTGRLLQQAGYDTQAHPREINLFYLSEGSRERIVFNEQQEKFEVLNTSFSFTKDEIIREVREFPERFSPNVMLRPLYQETILPNLAYVGGAGELSYWLQQKSIFEHYRVNFPMLILRNSAMLIDANTRKKLNKLNLSLNELFEDEETMVKKFVNKNSENTLDLTAEKQTIENSLNEALKKALTIDPTLQGAVEAQKAALLNGLEGLEKKIMRAEKRNFETALNQLKNVKSKLFPNQNLQERVENFFPFYAQDGDELINLMKKEFNPFRKEFLVMIDEG